MATELLALYSASGDARWAAFARELTSVITADFASDAGVGLRRTPPACCRHHSTRATMPTPVVGRPRPRHSCRWPPLGLRLRQARLSDGRGGRWDANAIRSQAEGDSFQRTH